MTSPGRVSLLLALMSLYSCLLVFGGEAIDIFTVQLSTTGDFCHACPVGPREALTALHCVSRRVDSGDRLFYSTTWSMLGGSAGSAIPIAFDTRRDLAVLKSDTDFGGWNRLAQKQPVVGDRVSVGSYLWDKWMKPVLVWTTLKTVIAGNLVYDKNPGGGSSGSCVFAESGEVIGINYGWVEPTEGKPIGLGNAVTPPWFPIPTRYVIELEWKQ